MRKMRILKTTSKNDCKCTYRFCSIYFFVRNMYSFCSVYFFVRKMYSFGTVYCVLLRFVASFM